MAHVALLCLDELVDDLLALLLLAVEAADNLVVVDVLAPQRRLLRRVLGQLHGGGGGLETLDAAQRHGAVPRCARRARDAAVFALAQAA